MKKKKNAFTLTELLIVVIVIGILAAVVFPKFGNIIETRKTAEAEDVMAAVRTEQEARCAMDKNYTTDAATVNLASLDTKNFTYTLNNAGITAASKGKYAYTLSMPSYHDGRFCCDSAEECGKLNKNYPRCADLTKQKDYESGAECASPTPPPTPEPKTCEGPAVMPCGCKGLGTKTRTCNTDTGVWSDWSACSFPDECECPQPGPDSKERCNTCGWRTRTVSCDKTTGTYVIGEWGACDKTPDECTSCPDGKVKDKNGNCVCADSYNITPTYTSCAGTAEKKCVYQYDMLTLIQYDGIYKWNEETCKCDLICGGKPPWGHLYFKCVKIIDLPSNMMDAKFPSYEEGKNACMMGDAAATYTKILSGYSKDPKCKAKYEYEDPPGSNKWVQCPMENGKGLVYRCSKEPPADCLGGGFCEKTCTYHQVHDDGPRG